MRVRNCLRVIIFCLYVSLENLILNFFNLKNFLTLKSWLENFFKVKNVSGLPFLFTNKNSGLVPLSIEVKRLEMSNEPDHVAWHIADDRSAWALCGRTSGVVAFDENSQETIQVDLMPLFMGTLRLPKVDIKRFLVNAPYNSPSEHDSSLSSIDSPLYKGM